MKSVKIVSFYLTALCCGSSAFAVTIEMVTIGNSGNMPDIRYDAIGFGSVSYTYQIGKYEITAGQYTEFLNAVAKADPNGLYNTAMGNPNNELGSNIKQNGLFPNFSYSVTSDWANRPVNNISFWDAARFANWLHNGQPTGPQGPGTTEDGAYHDVGNQSLFGRNPGARFFIPTENEWYKAAYHDQTAGLAASYFDYPTGTNSVPGNDIEENTNPGNNANYYNNNFVIGGPFYRTVVGEFEMSQSPYGTFDQGGNVWEWNETAVTASSLAIRGGAFVSLSSNLLASFRNHSDPTLKSYMGFRIASAVPEPAPVLSIGVVLFVASVIRYQNRSELYR
jgi:formylglycine-generating enzyme required for sulfatase activity